MKKNIYLVLFALLLGIGAVSCDNESEDLFEQTAAERKTDAIKEYDEALKSAENGWLFQYFPEEEQKYGGYNYIVKFKEQDSVIVWMEGEADPETSMYDVIAYGGPVLTFNTYNSLMHKYATPSADEYNAKGGDFEFLLMSNNDDVITLQGNKTGNDLRLIKLTETPEEYLMKLKSISKVLKGATFEGNVGGAEVMVISNYNRLEFTYSEGGENKVVDEAFIVTDKGIEFYKEISILGNDISELILDKATNQLVSENGEVVIDVISSPIDMKSTRWYCNIGAETDRSDAIRTEWEKVYIANGQTYGETLSQFLQMGPGQGATGIYIYSDKWLAQYNVIFGGVKGKAGYLDITKVGDGFNWSFYTHLMPLIDVVADNAPYKVELDDEDNPTRAKLTSEKDPDVWFILNKN
ncbi:DUF4302 domain-containing protein [Marinifilum sp. D714]|uniref:DUF4302 domain-containing protein n=1 Tax=Marinifilum sp. D714 TaxID=2937523 RepID=UPI0027C5E117|nr:DUF4302 domain-containing protein [Marinifilum sp. D714]MDQ2178445.1 DUF4302 domain-containing protein [Marinifilum sp. D714]